MPHAAYFHITKTVFALRTHYSAMKTELFENANENGYFPIRCVLNMLCFQCEHQKQRHWNMLTMSTKYVLSSTPNLKNFEIENSHRTGSCYN